jgi:hypothetical protein
MPLKRTKERQEKKRAEAQERAEARALRTPAQQIAKLDEGGHVATRERNRLANAGQKTALAAGR